MSSEKHYKGLPFASYPSSPGIMSPQSPLNGDAHARPSSDSVLASRVRTLEAQAQVQAAEVALLRQLGDDLGSWRYRVDSASTQTAHVLQHLNNDLDILKTKVAQMSEAEGSQANRAVVDDLVSQMRECYKDLQSALGRMNDQTNSAPHTRYQQQTEEDTVSARLKDVEVQLASAQALITSQDAINTAFRVELADIRASVAETGAVADHAAADAAMAGVEASAAANAAASAANEASLLSAQVQALRLGLECVEQSLEDLDMTDAVAALRSRVDDLDSGIEHAADEAMHKITQVQSVIEELRDGLARTEEEARRANERGMKAEAAAALISEDVAALRRDVRQRMMSNNTPMASPSNSAPVSPARSVSSLTTIAGGQPASDARLKAAVHTLSDGYRSLHRAMSMIYEEQSEVAERVLSLGQAAIKASSNKNSRTISERIKALNMSRGASSLRCNSFSLSISPRSLEFENAETEGIFKRQEELKKANERDIDVTELEELRALVAAQAADAAAHQRRADTLEAEVAEMRRLLCALAPAKKDCITDIVSEKEVDAVAVPAVPVAQPPSISSKNYNSDYEGEEKENEEAASLLLTCDEVTGHVVADITVQRNGPSSVAKEQARVHNGKAQCKVTRGAMADDTIPAVWSTKA